MGRARSAVLYFVLSLFLLTPLATQARSHHSYAAAANSSINIAELPPEARETLQLVKRGGPFPYPRDGVVFGNYEHALPQQPRGYYREYTVKTPGVHNRGPRRIVCGVVPARGRPMGSPVKGTPPDTRPPGGLGAAPLRRSDPFALPECYYSDDHYRSFYRITEGR